MEPIFFKAGLMNNWLGNVHQQALTKDYSRQRMMYSYFPAAKAARKPKFIQIAQSQLLK